MAPQIEESLTEETYDTEPLRDEVSLDELIKSAENDAGEGAEAANETDTKSAEKDAAGTSKATGTDTKASGKEDGAKTEDKTTNDDEDAVRDDDPAGVKKRIDKITRKRRDAERRADDAERERDALRKMILEIKSGGATGKDSGGEPDGTDAVNAATATESEPKMDDFDTMEDYHKALGAWSAKQAIREHERIQDEKAAQALAEKRTHEIEAKHEKGRAKHEDYDEVIDSVRVIPEVQEAVFDSDLSHELSYYLGTHPDLVDELNEMAPLQAVRKIGRIEAELTAQSSNASAQQVTKPVAKKNYQTVTPVSDSAGMDKDLGRMSIPELEKHLYKTKKG